MSELKMSVDALLVAAQFLEWSNHSDGKARGGSAHGGDDSPSDEVSLHSFVKEASSPNSVKESESPNLDENEVKTENTDEEANSAKAYWRRPGGAGSRETHKKLEKNRRAHLKECFENLRLQIPNIGDRKTSNLTILRQSLRWINVQRRREKEQDEELARLVQTRLVLQLKLSSLEQELRQMHVNVEPFLKMCAEDDAHSVSTATADNSPIVSDNEDDVTQPAIQPPPPVNQPPPAPPTSIPVTPAVEVRPSPDKSQLSLRDVTVAKPQTDLRSLAQKPSQSVLASTMPTGQTILKLPTGQTLITMPAAQAIVTVDTTLRTGQVTPTIMTTVPISQVTSLATSQTAVTMATTPASQSTGSSAPTKPQVARMLQQAITERQNRQQKLLQQQLKTLSEMTPVKTQPAAVVTQPQLLAVSAVTSSKPVTPLRPTVSLSHLLPSVVPSSQPLLRLATPTLLSCVPVSTPQPASQPLTNIKLASTALPRAQIISPAQLTALQQVLSQGVARTPVTTATSTLTMTPILSVGQGQVLQSPTAQVMSPMILTPTTVQLTPTTVQLTPTTVQLTPTTVQLTPTTVQLTPTTVQLTPTTVQLTASTVPQTPVLKTQVGSFPLVAPYTLPMKPVVVVSVPSVAPTPLSTSGQSTVVTLGNGL